MAKVMKEKKVESKLVIKGVTKIDLEDIRKKVMEEAKKEVPDVPVTE